VGGGGGILVTRQKRKHKAGDPEDYLMKVDAHLTRQALRLDMKRKGRLHSLGGGSFLGRFQNSSSSCF